MKICYV